MVTDIHAALGFDTLPLRLRKPPVVQPSRSWRHYFPVAAAVILVIALLGASFSTLVPDDDDGDQFASVPPVVLGITGQDTGTTTEVADATPELLTQENIAKMWGCGDILNLPIVVTKTDTLSNLKEAYQFNPANSLAAMKCNGQFVELIVLENTEVVQTSLPWTLLLDTGTYISVLNLKSMKSIQLQTEMSLDDIQRFNRANWDSRWLVIPDQDFVIDTTTMDVIALNGILGITTDLFFPTFSSSNDSRTMIVVAVEVWDESGPATHLVTLSSEDVAQTTEIPDPPEDILGLAVSPEGDRVAIRSSEVVNNSSVDVFEVLDLASGDVTDRIELPGDLRTSAPVWIDNDTFVFTNTGALHKAKLGSDETEVLYEEPGTGLAIYKTRDPNVVTLVQQRSNTARDQFEGSDAKKIITVNTSTGETAEYIGVDQTLSPNQEFVFTRNVILLETEPSVRSGAELHVQVIDPVTGGEIGQIDREDSGLRDGAIRSGGGAGNGDMRFFSWGSQHTYQVTTTNGHARLEQIPPPPGQASESDMAVGIRTAPDATWIAMHIETEDEWWYLDLTDPDATWVRLPENYGVYSIVLQP